MNCEISQSACNLNGMLSRPAASAVLVRLEGVAAALIRSLTTPDVHDEPG